MRDILCRFLTGLTLLAILAGFALPVGAQSSDPAVLQSVSARQYIVVDSATGEVLAELDPTKRTGIASLTKVFTAIVALERAPLSMTITAIDSDEFDASSTRMTGFAAGNTYTVQDLIYGMLLESGNDAAEALARGIGFQEGDTPEQSVARFVGWMNDKVAELGLQNTHFVNPHGLSNKDHYSTPWDIAAWMMYAVQNQDFMTIITARTYTDSIGVGHTNVNRGPEFISSYIGGKTGYDDSTGWCLIELGKKNDVLLISVTIDGVAPATWYQDHQTLLEYSFARRAERIAAAQPISGDVVRFTVAQAEEPTAVPDAVAPTAVPTTAVGQGPGPVGPVKIEGSPVVPPGTGAGTGGLNSGRTIWPALAVLLLLVVVIALRLLRPVRTPQDEHPRTPTEPSDPA
ncbi:MAG TPA: serine hydrolase [Thermomicrobiales bacterium]|nr:serine hydrolase [Thermomicrobiales bacterium]